LWSLGALSQTLVWDQQSGLHAGGGRPTAEFAAFCGALSVDWFFCEPRDPQAQGVVERLQDFLERNFEPGRRFANELDFQLQLDTWFTRRYQQAAAHTQAAGDQHHPAGEPGRGVHHAGRVQRSGRGPHNRRRREGRDQQGVLVDRFCGCMRACRDAQNTSDDPSLNRLVSIRRPRPHRPSLDEDPDTNRPKTGRASPPPPEEARIWSSPRGTRARPERDARN
jgi:hypothetical protein